MCERKIKLASMRYRSTLKVQGFSLVEVMIVLVIIGIIAGVAYPSYQSSVAKSKRSDAQAALVSFSQAMERHFAQNGTYLTAITGSAPQAPDIFSTQVPMDGTATYNLTVQAVTGSTYTLRATPVGGQVGDGYLEILSTGVRRWNENDSNLKACWDSSC